MARAQWTPALAHLAYALEVAPVNPEGRALLDRILRAARDPLGLVPLLREAETPYQIGAIRAYIYAWRGQLDEAIAIMAQVYQVVPGLPYLPWLVEWLSPERVIAVDPDRMAFLVWSLLGQVSDKGVVEHRETVEQLLAVFSSYCKARPQATGAASVLSLFARKLGKVDEAVVIARQAHSTQPGYASAAALGQAYQAKGDYEAAVEAYRQASSHDPENLDIRLDIGDILCGTGRVSEGIDAYREVLDREPNHPWSLPSYLYWKAHLGSKGPWRAQLHRYAEENPDNARAQELDRMLHAYIVWLPEPSDATISLLRHIDAQQDADHLKVDLSALESPSARLAVELYQRERLGKVDFTVSVAAIQEPDPRLPRGPVEYVLWRYEGVDPRPVIEPPSRRVAKAVAALAASPYRAEAWSGQARHIAAKLGVGRVGDLLGAMLHPPKRPPQFTIWVWLQRMQLAAAFVIAHLDPGWEGSVRKRVLFSLARGPMDWTVEAAVVALMQIAREESAATRDVAALYSELFDALPKPGSVPYLDALVRCSQHLPSLPEDLQIDICLKRGVARRDTGDVAGALADFDEAARLDPRLATVYVHRGIAHIYHGDYESAIADFDEEIRLDPQDAEAYRHRGFAHSRLGDYDGAIADYSEAIRIDPQSANAYNTRGIARANKNDVDDAIADYDEAIRLDPLHFSAYSNRGLARIDKGDYDGAIADCDEAIRLNPRFANAYNVRGNARKERGDYDGAITDYSEAIQIDPQYADAYTNRGLARKEKGDYDGAMADHNEAIRLDPGHAKAYNNRGAMRSDQGDRDSAIADYSEAIRFDPQFAVAYYNRGIAHKEKGDYDNAIADYSEAIRIRPGYVDAYNNRGVVRKEKGDYDGAIADYNEAIRLDPLHVSAYNNRGLARSSKGDRKGALADYNEAIRLDPDDAVAFLNRGAARGEAGNSDGALADFDEAIRLAPRLADAHMNRGVEHCKRKDYERAIADITTAIRLDPGNARAYSNRAAVRCELGDYDQAIVDCENPLRLDSSYALAYNNRGWAYLKKGDYDRALAESNVAIQLSQHGYFYNTRGQARGEMGDYTGAVADLQEALQLTPDHPEAEDIQAKIAEWSEKIK